MTLREKYFFELVIEKDKVIKIMSVKVKIQLIILLRYKFIVAR